MGRIFALHFKHLWQSLVFCLAGIQEANQKNDPELKTVCITRLIRMLFWRVIVLGAPGIFFSTYEDGLTAYCYVLFALYVVGIISAMLVEDDSPANIPNTRGIDKAKAEAEALYPDMQQAAYTLFCELCKYIPGLIVPSSPTAICGKTKYEIDAHLTAKYRFWIAKGQSDTTAEKIQQIFDTIIPQYLVEYKLPISVEPVYPGTEWPGLVVDGVYSAGDHYRVDFVITDEAEIKVLEAREAKRNDFDNHTTVTPPDPDKF